MKFLIIFMLDIFFERQIILYHQRPTFQKNSNFFGKNLSKNTEIIANVLVVQIHQTTQSNE